MDRMLVAGRSPDAAQVRASRTLATVVMAFASAIALGVTALFVAFLTLIHRGEHHWVLVVDLALVGLTLGALINFLFGIAPTRVDTRATWLRRLFLPGACCCGGALLGLVQIALFEEINFASILTGHSWLVVLAAIAGGMGAAIGYAAKLNMAYGVRSPWAPTILGAVLCCAIYAVFVAWDSIDHNLTPGDYVAHHNWILVGIVAGFFVPSIWFAAVTFVCFKPGADVATTAPAEGWR